MPKQIPEPALDDEATEPELMRLYSPAEADALVPHLEEVTRASGFRIARIRFYTPLVGGFVENVLMRMGERVLARRAAGRLKTAADASNVDARAIREARTAAKQRIARGGLTYGALRGLSFAMKLDLLLFGRVTSGPFFALLVKER